MTRYIPILKGALIAIALFWASILLIVGIYLLANGNEELLSAIWMSVFVGIVGALLGSL